MTLITNTSEILPFNAPATTRGAMYNRRLPAVLWMPVILYHQQDAGDSDLESAAAQLQVYFERKSDLTQIKRRVITPMVQMIEMPPFLIALLHPKQLNWMHNGVYLQAGYYGEPGVAGIARSVACAMTFNDTCVCTQGATDPSAHVAVPASAKDAHDFERLVQNYYRSGVGVWPKVLVEHRNRVLVMAHAIMLGRDPVAEYNRFLKARGVSFLDYPTLCPQVADSRSSGRQVENHLLGSSVSSEIPSNTKGNQV